MGVKGLVLLFVASVDCFGPDTTIIKMMEAMKDMNTFEKKEYLCLNLPNHVRTRMEVIFDFYCSDFKPVTDKTPVDVMESTIDNENTNASPKDIFSVAPFTRGGSVNPDIALETYNPETDLQQPELDNTINLSNGQTVSREGLITFLKKMKNMRPKERRRFLCTDMTHRFPKAAKKLIAQTKIDCAKITDKIFKTVNQQIETTQANDKKMELSQTGNRSPKDPPQNKDNSPELPHADPNLSSPSIQTSTGQVILVENIKSFLAKMMKLPPRLKKNFICTKMMDKFPKVALRIIAKIDIDCTAVKEKAMTHTGNEHLIQGRKADFIKPHRTKFPKSCDFGQHTTRSLKYLSFSEFEILVKMVCRNRLTEKATWLNILKNNRCNHGKNENMCQMIIPLAMKASAKMSKEKNTQCSSDVQINICPEFIK